MNFTTRLRRLGLPLPLVINGFTEQSVTKSANHGGQRSFPALLSYSFPVYILQDYFCLKIFSKPRSNS